MIKKLLFPSLFVFLALFALSCDELVEPVAITPGENQPVIISALSQTVSEDGSVIIDVEVQDGGDLMVQVVSQPVNGNATVVSQQSAKTAKTKQVLAGQIEYTPDEDFNGTDSFTFRVRDNITGFESSTVTMSITVTGTPDVPVVASGIMAQSAAPGMTVTINLAATNAFSDVDGDVLSFVATSADGNVATASVNGAVLQVTAGSAEGSSTTIAVTATDPGGLSAETSFEFTVTTASNNPPQAIGTIDSQTLAVGESATIDLTAVFSDPDGDALTYILSNSDESLVTVTVTGNVLTVTRIAAGPVSVTVQVRSASRLRLIRRVLR